MEYNEKNNNNEEKNNKNNALKYGEAPWFIGWIAYLFKTNSITSRDILICLLSSIFTLIGSGILLFQNDWINKKLEHFVNREKVEIVDENLLLQGHRQFQWQWAGENWLGYIEFNKVNDEIVASLRLDRVFKNENNGFEKQKKMVSERPGTVKIKDHKVIINNMRVQNWESSADDPEVMVMDHMSTLDFELDITTGFEGIVTYHKDGEEKEEGRIAIIYHKWVP